MATLDVDNVSTALLDLDKSQESRELVRRLEASGYFTITNLPASQEEIGYLLDKGEVLVALQINRGFSKDIKKHAAPAALQVLVDGTDSNSALIAMSHITMIVERFSQDLAVAGARSTRRGPIFARGSGTTRT